MRGPPGDLHNAFHRLRAAGIRSPADKHDEVLASGMISEQQAGPATLDGRLEAVDQEIADLQVLLGFMRRMERDALLRERLRSADLGFRLQDLWSGRITGEPLRRALDALDRMAAPAL